VDLAERLIAIHRALDEAAIPHAFGGAIALAYWTSDPRGTSDIDVNVFVPAEDCGRILEILPSGIEQPSGTEATIRRDGQVRLFWGETPVDLFFDNVPVHADAARHRRLVPFEGVEIPILGPIELALFKAMFDRIQDWADIEAMIAAERLDVEAVQDALEAMIGPDDDRLRKLDDVSRSAAPRPSPREPR
jgi:hypothetical protein